ncbi:uncharacterized protein RAG0_11176 [Rhynchosporium agropyri]|uniref:Uncharacterized protein n=1 Tax=Rhynchosporium agropyri TaxID=914238 RepID=A0A1E1L304_9HELO|nr:uncharacterized protein RAG0_11176 [Rhynchosporium agropyri]
MYVCFWLEYIFENGKYERWKKIITDVSRRNGIVEAFILFAVAGTRCTTKKVRGDGSSSHLFASLLQGWDATATVPHLILPNAPNLAAMLALFGWTTTAYLPIAAQIEDPWCFEDVYNGSRKDVLRYSDRLEGGALEHSRQIHIEVLSFHYNTFAEESVCTTKPPSLQAAADLGKYIVSKIGLAREHIQELDRRHSASARMPH